jgi:hypothetical protein
VSKVQYNLGIIDGEGRSLGHIFNARPDASSFRPLLDKFLSYPHPPRSGNAYRRNFVEKRLVVVVVAQAVVFLELCRWPSEGGSSSPDI